MWAWYLWETLIYERNFYLFSLINDYPGESIGLKFIPSELELSRAIPEFVSEPFRVIPNETKKLFVSRLMKNGQKTIRLNLL